MRVLFSSDFRIPQRPLSPEAQAAADRALQQVVALWPYLNFVERYDWAKRITAINGVYPEGYWQTVGLPLIMTEVEKNANDA